MFSLGLSLSGANAKLPAWCKTDSALRHWELRVSGVLGVYVTFMQVVDPFVQVCCASGDESMLWGPPLPYSHAVFDTLHGPRTVVVTTPPEPGAAPSPRGRRRCYCFSWV